jgi:putative acetyltransferase
MKIKLNDLTHPQVKSLLHEHLKGMQENSPKDSVYALDVSELKAQDISFWVVWEDDNAIGCGALKELSPKSGEIKSMRTHTKHLRQGVAAQMLEHIIATAKTRGYSSLSLETGTGPAFEPAVKLYAKYGFKQGNVFSSYQSTPFNQFLHLNL